MLTPPCTAWYSLKYSTYLPAVGIDYLGVVLRNFADGKRNFEKHAKYAAMVISAKRAVT